MNLLAYGNSSGQFSASSSNDLIHKPLILLKDMSLYSQIVMYNAHHNYCNTRKWVKLQERCCRPLFKGLMNCIIVTSEPLKSSTHFNTLEGFSQVEIGTTIYVPPLGVTFSKPKSLIKGHFCKVLQWILIAVWISWCLQTQALTSFQHPHFTLHKSTSHQHLMYLT